VQESLANAGLTLNNRTIPEKAAYSRREPKMTTRLNELLQAAPAAPLTPAQEAQFATYLELLLRWNARTNLTAIRDAEGILSRHFVESILCAQNLPDGIQTLLDFGSGAGFPGLPIAILREDLSVSLAESQNKKSSFLREVVRTLGLPTKVHSGRAEGLKASFDCITLRAVDHMDRAIPAALDLLNPAGWLTVMTTIRDSEHLQSLAPALVWSQSQPLPPNIGQILLFGQKQ
jgi:16S rRNA (guanine527-N7)-methyltransferase